jgi:hypothetical protein
MTLSTTTSRVSFSGNGATTTFAFSFKIWASSDLKVYLRDTTTLIDTLQTLTTHYTIDIVTYPNTGNVVFVTAPATGKTVVIVRDMALTQDLDLIASGAFAAENVEIQLDKLVAEIQTLREKIARVPIMPIGTALVDLALPEIRAAVAANFLGVNATGDGWSLYASTISTVGVSAYALTLLDDTTAAQARTTLGLANISTVAYLTGSATIDFANVADNVTATGGTTITVTGAVTGDFVQLTSNGNIMTTAGALLYGKVTSANTVTAYLLNDSGGAFDAASQTVYALVIPKANVGL